VCQPKIDEYDDDDVTAIRDEKTRITGLTGGEEILTIRSFRVVNNTCCLSSAIH